jgi:hypothetical protein
MTVALGILIGLVGYEMGLKLYQVIKIMGIRIDNMNQTEIEELLKDKRFRKYMR